MEDWSEAWGLQTESLAFCERLFMGHKGSAATNTHFHSRFALATNARQKGTRAKHFKLYIVIPIESTGPRSVGRATNQHTVRL